MDSLLKLKRNEFLRNVFNPNNIAGLTHPLHDGTEYCLKFHCLGKCDPDCPRKATHVPLSGTCLTATRKFVHTAKRKWLAFREAKKNNSAPAASTADERKEGE